MIVADERQQTRTIYVNSHRRVFSVDGCSRWGSLRGQNCCRRSDEQQQNYPRRAGSHDNSDCANVHSAPSHVAFTQCNELIRAASRECHDCVKRLSKSRRAFWNRLISFKALVRRTLMLSYVNANCNDFSANDSVLLLKCRRSWRAVGGRFLWRGISLELHSSGPTEYTPNGNDSLAACFGEQENE